MSNTNDIANMFIIPNTRNALCVNNQEEIFAEMDRYTIQNQGELIDLLGISPEYKLRERDAMVELWFCGLGSDNWSDHGLPKELRSESAATARIPSLWPARCFTNLKEGDKITMTINGHDVDITACQLEFRYRGFGTFENTMQYVTRNVQEYCIKASEIGYGQSEPTEDMVTVFKDDK